MLKPFLTAVLCALLSLPFAAQDYLGWDTLPAPETLIDDLPYMGEANDFSGGVQAGDLCPDFTVYDLNGIPTTLYDELRPDQYTILVSMSQSCVRVIQGLDPNLSPGTVNFMEEFGDQFNWVPVYVDEAHPADVENCPSNCTGTVILSLDGDSIFSHETYEERQLLAQELVFFGNNPSYTFTYPWDEIYLDNPDNSVLVEVFQAPFAMVVLDCAGNVILKEPFMNSYLNDTNNWTNLISLAEQADSDNDDICNIREEFLGTDPFDPCDPNGGDSDEDGLCDNLEENQGTDPFDPCDPFVDVDQDGVCDFEDVEVDVPPCEEDPTDSDGDGICDAQEAADGTNPDDPCDPDGTDTDGDGLCDMYELLNGSEPLDPCDPFGEDTDGDGYCDNLELVQGNDPDNPCDPDFIDSDGDGYCNLLEIQNGWGPGDACDPDNTDTDQDGYCDVEEGLDGTDPEDPCDPDDTDTDGDGTCDNQEILDGTDPFVDESSVGIEEALLPQIAAYPNPVKDLLLLTADRPVAQVDVLASSGQLVTSVRGQTVLDSSAWSPGVYTLRVLTTDGQQAVLRVIK